MHTIEFTAAEPPLTAQQLVSDVLAEIGGPVPVPPAQLVVLLGLRLEPHDGEPLSPADLGDAVELGFAGGVPYNCTLPQSQQDRAIALACARWLAEEHGLDPSDLDLVECVACALCGIPRPGLRSTRPPPVTPAAAAANDNE